MKPGHFKVNQDGDNLSATIVVQSTFASRALLYTLNILFIAVIILFTIGGVGVIVLFILAFEILFLRYSLWNLYGAETIILSQKTLTYQLSYGLIKLPEKVIPIHQSIKAIPFYENFQGGDKALKLAFESFDDRNEPVNIYQTKLVISQQQYQLFIKSFNRSYT